jgi:hypothetical protein
VIHRLTIGLFRWNISVTMGRLLGSPSSMGEPPATAGESR